MISLLFGNTQRFRYRHEDINVIGRTHVGAPVVRSEYSLNGGPAVGFYVERESPGGTRNRLENRTASGLRLWDQPGSFNIEIPVATPSLREGTNRIEIGIQHAGEQIEVLDAELIWDSRPVPLPLSLVDLGGVASITEIGQVVDGNFEIDSTRNVIRTVEPVSADALLLLGSPAGSQEATYDVRFGAMEGVFLGLSDFFVRHEPLTPGLGIKPGYSSAGLATVRPHPMRRAEAWLLRGALADGVDGHWTLSSPPTARAAVTPGVTYRVRHQVIFAEGVNLVRFRLWPKGAREPRRWLCFEHDADLDASLQRHACGSFGLFQFGGRPTEWSNIHVRSIDVVDRRTRSELRMKKMRAPRSLRTLRRKARLEHRLVSFASRLTMRVPPVVTFGAVVLDSL